MNNKESIFHRLEVDLNKGVKHEKLFPEFFNPEVKKVKILFVAPRIDAYGYYQQILPALYFNRKSSKYITACITNIAKSKQELDCSIDEKYTIRKAMIEQSNIIVFPFIEQDLTDVYRTIRAINANAKIIYTVDFDFYNVPATHYKAEILKKKEVIQAIERNIFYSDKVFVPKESFINYIAEKLHNKFPEQRSIVVDTIPFYISGKNYAHINMTKEPERKRTDGLIRIGIISYWHTLEDQLELKEVMEWLVKQYPKKFEFLIWGQDFTTFKKKKPGRKPKKKPRAIKLPKTVLPMDSFLYYYKDLYNLNLDALIVHRKPNDWNKNNREPHEMLDASFYRIPVLSNVQSELMLPSTYNYYRDIEELKGYLSEMITTIQPFKHVAQEARNYIIESQSIDEAGVKGSELESVYLSFDSDNVWKDNTPAEETVAEPPANNDQPE